MERTYRFKQRDIARAVDANTARKAFALSLPHFGPYALDYTRSGRFLAMAGRKGHVSVIDFERYTVMGEVHTKEICRDIKFLHNESMYAVAQNKVCPHFVCNIPTAACWDSRRSRGLPPLPAANDAPPVRLYL